MRVFVATSATQGARASDSNGCVDGELVWMVDACRSGLRNPYGACPGGRTFRGVSSDADTTTALVRDIAGLTGEDIVDALLARWQVSGQDPDHPALIMNATLLSYQIVSLATRFPAGQVVERRGNTVYARTKTLTSVKR